MKFRRLLTWGFRVFGRVVVRFGMYEFRVFFYFLKKENYILLSVVIFLVSRNNMLLGYNL